MKKILLLFLLVMPIALAEEYVADVKFVNFGSGNETSKITIRQEPFRISIEIKDKNKYLARDQVTSRNIISDNAKDGIRYIEAKKDLFIMIDYNNRKIYILKNDINKGYLIEADMGKRLYKI